MQNKFIEGFKKFDAFGALYQTTITYQQKEYKTFIGALITLLIYSISFAFLFYNIIQWQTGQMLPKVITTNVVYTEYQFTYSDVLFTLSGDPQRSKFTTEINYDPFDPQQLLIQPMFQINIDGAPSNIDYEIVKNNETHLYNFQLRNLTFIYQKNSSVEKPSITFWVQLVACTNSTLPSGMVCASQDKIDSYLNQSINYIIGNLKLKQYNSNTRKSELIDNSMYIVIERANTYFGQVLLNVQQTKTDDGFLFPSYSSEQYIGSQQASGQQVSGQMMYPYYQKEMYFVIQFQISPIISEQVVQFPKFNEILADTGSMVSVIFYISILAKLINEKFQNLDVINQIITFYYPKFKNIRFKCNWLGQYSQVLYQDKPLDTKRFKVQYEKLVQIARQKLSLSNQLYEISRLQFIVQSLQSRKYIQQSHRIGIQLQDFTENPEFFQNNQNQVLPMLKSGDQSHDEKDEKVEKIAQKSDQEEILKLKVNNSQVLDLKIYNSEENPSLLLADEDFGLLLFNQSDETSSPLIKDCWHTNFIEFYKQNQIE